MPPNKAVFNPEKVPFLALPWRRFEDRKDLPACAAIYFVCDAKSKVLYIGQSTNLVQRLMSHNRIDQFRTVEHCRIIWLEISDTTLLPAIEDACIAYFCPPWNNHWHEKNRVDIKITGEAHRFLRLIAAETEEKRHEVLLRLLAAEWAQIKQISSMFKHLKKEV